MSHEWTDYSQVQNLYADGHEIASHTVTHSHGTNFNEEKWANEVKFSEKYFSNIWKSHWWKNMLKVLLLFKWASLHVMGTFCYLIVMV